MRSAFLLFAAAMGACFAGVALGCAAGSADMDAPPPTTHSQHVSKSGLATVSEFCAARAEAECSSAVVSACGLTGMSAVPQGTTYQPTKAQACLDAVTAAYSTSTITATALASLDPACGPDLFAGPGAARAPCATDYDCDSAKGLSC